VIALCVQDADDIVHGMMAECIIYQADQARFLPADSLPTEVPHMTYKPYQHVAAELLRSREADAPYMVWVGDCRHKGADIYYSQRLHQWVVIAMDGPQATFHNSLAVVTLAEGTAAGERLAQVCLACDLDEPCGVWVVDANALEGLRRDYGEALQVAWQADAC
jgi:hypothetical protein